VLKVRSVEAKDWMTLRRINNFEWNIADTRGYAPNDFPYLDVSPLKPSPSMILRRALEMQTRGDATGAEKLLMDGKNAHPFAACEFRSSLAVIYYTTNRKEFAMRELESVQSLVNPASTTQCVRSQYLLGSLYKEMSRLSDAENVFRHFLVNTEGSTDPEILSFRKAISAPRS